jgi:hypothetical protein
MITIVSHVNWLILIYHSNYLSSRNVTLRVSSALDLSTNLIKMTCFKCLWGFQNGIVFLLLSHFFLLAFPVLSFTIVQEIFSDGMSEASVEEKNQYSRIQRTSDMADEKIFYVRPAVRSHKCHCFLLKKYY